MFQLIGKTAIAVAIPLIITKTLDGISEYIKELVGDTEVKKVSNRTKADFTKLTQYHYDYIVQAYKQHILDNTGKKRGTKETQITLVNRMNTKMGMNKSRASLARIWNGKIARKDLAVGSPSFDYEL